MNGPSRVNPMNKTRILFLLALAGVTASLILRHRTVARLAEFETLRQQRRGELIELKTEQQRLLVEVAAVTNRATIDHSAELNKLRALVETLQSRTNELAKAIQLHSASNSANSRGESSPGTPESFARMNQASLNQKAWEAAHITTAMWDYAGEHQNQFPTSLDQVDPYLAKRRWRLSGMNQFEIVYQGSRDQLDGIPEQLVAAIRETATWLGPDGKPARVYGIFPYSSTVVAADNFRSWEAEHIFLMANPVNLDK